MRRSLRVTMDFAAGATLIAVALLGAWWASDRARSWERPRWSSASFELLRPRPPIDTGGGVRWVMAINPRCPSCLRSLWRIHAAWSRRPGREGLVALIVDTPARPDARSLRRLPPIAVWWDRENRWRRRWGHRLYGELLQFDGSGQYVRTISAGEVPRLGGPRAPDDSTAPALEGRGGT